MNKKIKSILAVAFLSLFLGLNLGGVATTRSVDPPLFGGRV